MFASRHYGRLQERFEEDLAEPGRQIVIYGDTGVGKTSLVRHICDEKRLRMVYVECGQPFEDMLKEALAKAGITEERFEAIDEKSAFAGVRGTLAFLYAGGRHNLVETTTSTSYPVSIPTAVREALTLEGFDVLFLDNFENLRPRDYGESVATEIVQLMKSFSDREGGGVKVVVAGIPSEAESLVALDEATARRTSEIEVPRMPDEELDEILRKGEAKLKVEFDPDCRASIIRYSDGFPYYTHLHALHASRRALRDGEERIGLNHFMSALDAILENAALSLRRSYANAVETGRGTVRTRKSIMEAVARTERQEMTFGQIKASFWKIHPKYDNLKQLDFISPHLNELVDKYGILQSRGVPRSADRKYRFSNPLMRAYVRLKAEQEQYMTPQLDVE
jgi:hypothetical protein